ncbi:P-loop containing nucleoside triphosphate hydrolase protein [Apodospora peruviana]|uniref:ATP-dependent RNA helicase n=1 Tax=Apodospora peruviana TaxID=516989 RepID=A0AAE0M2E3_9PEZI|nr:P-loop containing nucleoside triphosphate hydrolase protein [Apodospora peruviana]
MYNRYIPPPKGSQPAVPTASVQLNSNYNKPPSTLSNDESERATVAAQSRKLLFDDNDFPATSHKPNRDIDELLTGTVTSEKELKETPKAPQKTENDSRGHKEKALGELPGEPKQKKQKRGDNQEQGVESAPKREKKKAKKPKNDGIEDGEDEVRKRHRTVFEKVQKAVQAKPDASQIAEEESGPEEEEEVHDLAPIPQPDPVVFDESKITYDSLPPWLSSPIRVTRETRCSFADLGIAPKSASLLQSKGFQDAFAVQAVAIPMLTPVVDRQGDVVISAPTGSGKTLSYVLPMVRDISQGLITRMRGIIIVPTRDLVPQVHATCEACASAFAVDKRKRVKVGTAVGSHSLEKERKQIMKEEQKYDPAGYDKYMARQRRLVSLDSSDDEEDDPSGDNPDDGTRPLPYHVVVKSPDVDILICTPGRLVEHIKKTKGFTLDYVRWLVVDEADKLLAQDYQQWLGVVMEKLSTTKLSYRDFPNSNKTGPRKVILSATMTRDLSLLNGLKLSRPRLVVLEGTKSGEHLLPSSLKEYAIKVRDPGLKPLYLVDLLAHITPITPQAPHHSKSRKKAKSVSESESSSSDADSLSDSDSSSSSDSDSSSSSDSDSSDTEQHGKKQLQKSFQTTVLIFTKSNEAALRLSRLLSILTPEFAPLIGTLTSSTKTSKRTHILGDFARGKLRILVASDLVSRGIDLANLDHVVNYDLPTNETSYVHRVGRTARAGKEGHAWTLYEHAQGRRFWRDFVGQGEGAATDIVRSRKVERLQIGSADLTKENDDKQLPVPFEEGRIKAYEDALEQLGKEARG